jgi:hypothetical protein
MVSDTIQTIEGRGEVTMSKSTVRVTGWSAYANGILMVANMITLSLMFAVNPMWGPVNDAISVFWALSFVPLALLFVPLNRHVLGRGTAVGTAVAGMAALLLFAALQSLLVVGLVRFEQTFAAVVALGGIMGLWLLANGLLALKGNTLPRGLSWLTTVFGFSYVLAMIGFLLGGYENPTLWAGAAIGFLIGPVWAFWLGWLLLRGRVASPAFDRASSRQA